MPYDFGQATTANFNVKNKVYCSVCSTLISTEGDGFTSAVCAICQAGIDGKTLTPEFIAKHQSLLPNGGLIPHLDLSTGSNPRDMGQETVFIGEKRLTFGEKVFQVISSLGKKPKRAPDRTSKAVVKDKKRTSVFSLGDMESVDSQLSRDKEK